MSAYITKLILRLFASGVLPAIHDIVHPPAPSNNTDIGLTVPELITKYGYPVETHSVVTEDGYILGVHRIPNGKIENNNYTAEKDNNINKPVVFLMIGLLCSSADWIIAGPGKALGYLLADTGYDVWMGNARGTTHSKKHIKYNPETDAEFWKYSWHEMGIYDLPAMIDYTLNYTNSKEIYYIGHSQGTTSFFVMCSERPEYNEKIKLMIALAPVAFMSNVKNPFLQVMSKYNPELRIMAKMFGINEFLPDTKFTTFIGRVICNEKSMTSGICTNVLFLIAGFDYKQLNQTILPAILSNVPAGASVRQLFHYAQGVKSGKFQQYDFNFIKNYKKYKQFSPPEYNLSRITAPISLIYSENDLLTAPKDVKILSTKLQNLVELNRVNQTSFNHLDFLWAINVVGLVYNHVFDLLQNY
ncbi:lipase 3-like [Chrysoperla carnea]|uniref:lipase 3-like n=1 Tax=Chrysoperla carnea TaxID=189513 RepID=UPI001D089E17|nr:lipase 3-like [Chrysoperla carnea]